MINGLYFVEFQANTQDFGQGLAVIDNGRINGGDHAYLYQGRIDAYGSDVKAVIEVKHYRGQPASVFGPLNSFTLNLAGKNSGSTFEVSGGIANMPGTKITIRGKKVAELYK